MPDAIPEQDRLRFHRGVEKLKAEVAMFEAAFTDLEQQSFRSSPLMRKLGRYCGFGAAGKLEWAAFKLNFKQEQLDQFKAGSEIAETTERRETARQKMERMIAENPAELEPHIRRAYQPLLEAEK